MTKYEMKYEISVKISTLNNRVLIETKKDRDRTQVHPGNQIRTALMTAFEQKAVEQKQPCRYPDQDGNACQNQQHRHTAHLSLQL